MVLISNVNAVPQLDVENEDHTHLETKEELVKRKIVSENAKRELLLSRYKDDPLSRPHDVVYRLSFINKYNLHSEYQKFNGKVEFQLFGDFYHSPEIRISLKNAPIDPLSPLEVDLPATCDVGDIIMIYIHNLSSKHDFFIEYIDLTNTKTKEKWEIPCFSFVGVNTHDCKLSSLFWVHPYSSLDCVNDLQILTSVVSQEYDLISSCTNYFKMELTIQSKDYKWKIDKRHDEWEVLHDILTKRDEQYFKSSKLNEYFPQKAELQIMEESEWSEEVKVKLQLYINEVAEHRSIVFTYPEFRAFLQIPPSRLRLGEISLGVQPTSTLKLSSDKKKKKKKGIFSSIVDHIADAVDADHSKKKKHIKLI